MKLLNIHKFYITFILAIYLKCFYCYPNIEKIFNSVFKFQFKKNSKTKDSPLLKLYNEQIKDEKLKELVVDLTINDKDIFNCDKKSINLFLLNNKIKNFLELDNLNKNAKINFNHFEKSPYLFDKYALNYINCYKKYLEYDYIDNKDKLNYSFNRISSFTNNIYELFKNFYMNVNTNSNDILNSDKTIFKLIPKKSFKDLITKKKLINLSPIIFDVDDTNKISYNDFKDKKIVDNYFLLKFSNINSDNNNCIGKYIDRKNNEDLKKQKEYFVLKPFSVINIIQHTKSYKKIIQVEFNCDNKSEYNANIISLFKNNCDLKTTK